MMKLHLGADWTGIKFTSQWDLGDTVSMGMHFGNMPQMDMSKMLMPQDAKLIARKMM
jgi:hypothetical protein